MVYNCGVVIPVYNVPELNRFGFLPNTVESLRRQNVDFCCYIVDHGSTERQTLEYLESIGDERFVVEKIERQAADSTPARPINHGFNCLWERGVDAFCYLHSDDVFMADSLVNRLLLLADHDMVYGEVAYVKDGQAFPKKIETYGYSHNSPDIMGTTFSHHTSMWSRKMMERMRAIRGKQLINPEFISNEDFDLTLLSRRLLMDNEDLSLGYLDKLVYLWFIHPGNISNTTEWGVQKKEIERIFEANGFAPEVPDVPKVKLTARLISMVKYPGSLLPEEIKARLRPHIRKLTGGRVCPEPPEPPDIDIEWFKH